MHLDKYRVGVTDAGIVNHLRNKMKPRCSFTMSDKP